MGSNRDLLRPSLEPEDDLVAFERPWSPTQLLWVAFLGGVPAAGILYALNFKYLGKPRLLRPTILITLLLTVTLIVALGYVSAGAEGSASAASDQRLIRWGHRLLGLVFAWILRMYQHRSFGLFENSGGKPRPLLKAAVLAIVTGLAISIGLTAAIHPLLPSP